VAEVIGTDNQDNLDGTGGADNITGKRGDDFIFGLGGDDIVNYFTHTDVSTSDGSDIVDGGDGYDRLRVFSDQHFWFVGSNSAIQPMTFALQKGADGFAHFISSQNWANYPSTDPSTSGTYVVDVTLKNVEEFSFTGSQLPATNSSSGLQPFSVTSHFTTTDTIVVGDLSGTALTGTLVFDLGTDGDSLHQTGGDFLDASAAVNKIVALGGVGDDKLYGGAGDDELHGDAGNDELRGGGGNNTLIGGDGNDIYYSDNRFDSIIETANGGFDTIRTTANYYGLRDNVEGLSFVGTGDFTGIGTSGNDSIAGGAGNDYLIGAAGDDILRGFGGANALQGGTGDDTYYSDNVGDTLIEFAGEGTDTVVTTLASYTLRANFENLTCSGSGAFHGEGNSADNVLTGGSGNDVLYGFDGNDTLIGNAGSANQLIGGAGNDTYIVSVATDQIVEQAGEGTDTVQVSGISYTLSDNVENLVNTATTGSGIARLVGNQLANDIQGGAVSDNLDGGAGNDVLHGGAGNDFLTGGAGDDVIIGGTGADELTGGAGADRFVFDSAASTGQDLLHDFSRAEGDKLDVSQLLQSVHYSGTDPFADGYLVKQEIAAYGPTGEPATKLLFDPDGSAGSAAAISLTVLLGPDHSVVSSDFIF
jgi:Ca2+-binding RTX toxin-like protein